MPFTPTAEKLMPDLTPREELVLLARTLWREGYNDHLAGHITISLGDGTLLCNPWLLTWDEIRPSDVIRIDLAGNVVEGDWPVPLGIPLHLELHRSRDDVRVAMHNHPRTAPCGPTYARSRRPSTRVRVWEVVTSSSSMNMPGRSTVPRLPPKPLPPSATLISLYSPATAYSFSAQRCELFTSGRSHSSNDAGWLGMCERPGELRSALPDWFSERFRRSDGDNFIGFWEAMVRAELRADPTLLEIALVDADHRA